MLLSLARPLPVLISSNLLQYFNIIQIKADQTEIEEFRREKKFKGTLLAAVASEQDERILTNPLLAAAFPSPGEIEYTTADASCSHHQNLV